MKLDIQLIIGKSKLANLTNRISIFRRNRLSSSLPAERIDRFLVNIEREIKEIIYDHLSQVSKEVQKPDRVKRSQNKNALRRKKEKVEKKV